MARVGPRKPRTEVKASLRTCLGDVIRETRIRKDITQKEAAASLGVAQSVWSRIEHGGINLTVERMIGVAAVLEEPMSRVINKAERKLDRARSGG